LGLTVDQPSSDCGDAISSTTTIFPCFKPKFKVLFSLMELAEIRKDQKALERKTADLLKEFEQKHGIESIVLLHINRNGSTNSSGAITTVSASIRFASLKE
jgi:hypothetical protein